MCDVCDEYEVPGLHVCTPCAPVTTLVVEVTLAALEIDTCIGDGKQPDVDEFAF